MSYTIGSIMPRVAAKLNDFNQSNFTNDTLIPFAQDAADELQIELELNGLPVTEKVSPAIVVPLVSNYNPGVNLSMKTLGLLPNDMMEPQKLEERLSGSNDTYALMTRRMWEPDILPTDSLRYWDYREEDIYMIGATTTRDVKIFYLKRLFTIVDTNSIISVNNSQQFMINRIAAMAARDIGENSTRADQLDGVAGQMLDKVVRIGIKSKQGVRTRRRPFTLQGRRRWA